MCWIASPQCPLFLVSTSLSRLCFLDVRDNNTDLHIPSTYSSYFVSCSGGGGEIYLVRRCLEGCFQAASFAEHCALANAAPSQVPRQPGQYGIILGSKVQSNIVSTKETSASRQDSISNLFHTWSSACQTSLIGAAFLVALADTFSEVWDLGL